MLHPSSGFRGTRAGVTEGTGSSLENGDPGKSVPRMRVTYTCASGHLTQPVFCELPEDQIPAEWECRRCGGAATRDGLPPEAHSTTEEGYKTHLEYVKERRSGEDAEAVLAGALERLRARGVLPDELLGDT
ncbi:RNA polymerase-binding protein RbpA [Pseudarthrobacter sp. NPDC092419]|uniref:RNA polymerase-binding protein RbpA n=1 Tax=Pseudarthrobacter sp. NPDC092419 TaxID=3364414 RepID=UPI0037FD4282